MFNKLNESYYKNKNTQFIYQEHNLSLLLYFGHWNLVTIYQERFGLYFYSDNAFLN